MDDHRLPFGWPTFDQALPSRLLVQTLVSHFARVEMLSHPGIPTGLRLQGFWCVMTTPYLAVVVLLHWQ